MLKTNEDVLKEILEQSLAGYWDWDIPSGNEYLSPTFKRMFGYEDHEIENRADSWQKLIFQEDLPGVYDKFNQHEESKGEIPFYNEIRYHHKNGSTVWVVCTGKVIEWDENGKAKRMVGCHIDITERKQTEISLQESESQFHDLFEKAPLGYQSLDSDGRFIEVNNAWLETLGYNREEVIGKWFGDFLAPEYVQAFRERFPVFKAQGKIHSEFFMLHKEGSRSFIAFDGRIGHNTDGSFKQTHCILKDETARKQAEDALRAKDALHSKMISNIGDVIVIIDQNGINRYKSPNIEKWFGWKPEDVLGCSAFDNVHPDDQERGQAFVGALALTPNATGTTEVRYRCKDGSYKWIEITIVNLFHDPTINGFLGNYRDITERKLAENHLKESEEKFSSLMQQSPFVVELYDLNGLQISVNKAYEELWNFPAETSLNKFNVLESKEVEETGLMEYVKRAYAGDSVVVPEYLFDPTGDTEAKGVGRKRWLSTRIYPLKNESGNVKNIVIVHQDITDRKRAEETLRENNNRAQAMLQAIPDLMFRLDSRGVFLDYKADVNDLHAQSELSIIGKRNRDISPPEFADLIDLKIRITLETGILQTFEYQLPIPGRGIRDYEARMVASGADEVTTIVREITERKRMEAALNNTQKLESLGVLAGGIAHDFNNLMAGIFGYMDMALNETKETKVTTYLSKAMNTIDRARALTGQLLTFSKGGAPIQKIDHLFPFVEETAKFALSGSNVLCNFDVPQDLWACNFDKNQIGQVIDNLIINAQQAMPVGGTIELSARNISLAEKEHPVLEKGDYVKISIKDSGIGIPKELLAKLFDPFFTTKEKGHGLGLATCYSIINRHGGCIDVESEQGKGSTFKVYLPASTENVSSVNENAAKTHKGSGIFLIMDDEEVIRDTISAMLETLGYTIVTKDNGKDAINFFISETKANRKIAGMIFDLTVPGGMGGKAAIEGVRKLNKNIPAFVASGYADDPVMKNPNEYGFMASISKPFRLKALVEMLNRYMKPKK